MFEKFKLNIGNKVFKKELIGNSRKRMAVNLDNAKSIGILFDATTDLHMKKIKPIVDYFFELKKDVKAVGFVNSKKYLDCHIPRLQYDFFNRSDLNWHYKPQNDYIKNFIKKDYDILINLSDSSCVPLKYLVASSLARFKVGKYEEGFDIYDLMIKLDKKTDTTENLIVEVIKYLNVINK